ncbi:MULTISPECIES: M10 family metallopeptidase C-terminal domain-containing protein [Pseudomonas]|uniref:Type I secretion target n=1 Tax=Pseudomonas quercus TaxID=2722792 RepID=A0ABX0YD37_9PSED|nr:MULTISPECIES: M10 family metallopeptidase C-terminal domain-containing protein [Pseudomonas]MBF7142736.1 M10 family metallopeptidase C-terminal domain-containing protein [Pseudomonas sp. LY10J]NJP01274.1 type I secretion target [Pseudomonas quercus]
MTPDKNLQNASILNRYNPSSIIVDVAGFEDINQSIAVQADGKILVAGFSYYEGASETDYNYSVVRFNPNGLLDTDYGFDGRQLISAEVPIAKGYSLTVQNDGSLLVQTPAHHNGTDSFGLTRLLADGTADTAFNANAKANIPAGLGSEGTQVTVNAAGKLLISQSGDQGAVLVQLNADGTLDKTFGNQGVANLAAGLSFSGEVDSVALGNGQFLLAGTFDSGSGNHYGIARVNADGTLDSSFGEAGKVMFSNNVLSDVHGALAVQGDGKIVLVGSNDSHADFQVVRLSADGQYDSSFGANGVASIDTQGAYDSARSVTVLNNGKLLIAGVSDMGNGHTIDFNSDVGLVRVTPEGQADTSFSSEEELSIDGSNNNDLLQGGDLDEILSGYDGDDVYQGNGGRDRHYDGNGADVFRFVSVEDSYRTATTAASDTLIWFHANEDRIDLIGLGFSGIGNGHNGTLAIGFKDNQTFLKSYDYNAAGNRFELILNGNYLGQLDESNVLFKPVNIQGSSGRDTLEGSAVKEVLSGLAGDDRLNGGADDDVLIGGEGRDLLSGGSGHDVFRFVSASDSYRDASTSHADLITDFSTAEDRLDVSALGFTGLGDGKDGTLLVSYNASLQRTFIKDLTADAQGHRFEVSLVGDLKDSLHASNFQFSDSVTELVAIGVPAEHV